jgi:hypothetical protein
MLWVAAGLGLSTFFALAGPSWELAAFRLLFDGACAVLWLVAAAGIGWPVWRFFFAPFDSPTDAITSVLTATALGIGAIGLVVLALGRAGWLNQAMAIALVTLGLLSSAIIVVHRRKVWEIEPWLRSPAKWSWLWALLAPVMGLTAVGAFFPSGLLWGDEPNGYDVVEYHLQVPREWFEAGHIVPLLHNVFSYFPFNVEMHYLLAMHLRGGPWAGMYLAQLMHAAMCGLSVVAVYALAGGGRHGTIAAAITAAVPWIPLLEPVAYNEGGTLLFGILAIGWAMRAHSARQFALAGVMAGLACGSKLSICPVLLIGVPLALAALHRFDWRRSILACIAYLLAAILLLSPWLLQDWTWSGNPVFPEGMSHLGKGHFSDVQVQRWQRANEMPDKNHRSPAGRLAAIWQQVLRDGRYGFILFPLGCAALILSVHKRTTLYLAVLLVIQTVFWLCFTHVQGRFMVIVIPIIALLISQCDRPWWPMTSGLAAVLLICWCTVLLAVKEARFIEYDRKVAKIAGIGVLGRENLELLCPMDLTRLGPQVQLDLLGDARAFWYQIPMSRLYYKTVFDVNTSDPRQNIADSWLAGMPRVGALVYTDNDDLARFAATYWGIGRLPWPTTR